MTPIIEGSYLLATHERDIQLTYWEHGERDFSVWAIGLCDQTIRRGPFRETKDEVWALVERLEARNPELARLHWVAVALRPGEQTWFCVECGAESLPTGSDYRAHPGLPEHMHRPGCAVARSEREAERDRFEHRHEHAMPPDWDAPALRHGTSWLGWLAATIAVGGGHGSELVNLLTRSSGSGVDADLLLEWAESSGLIVRDVKPTPTPNQLALVTDKWDPTLYSPTGAEESRASWFWWRAA